MRLRDGRSTVTVYPASTETDPMGGARTVWGEAHMVRASPQWATPHSVESLSLAPDTALVVIAPEWGFPALSRFTWDGCTFEQIGEPKRFYGSARTAHMEIHARHIASTPLYGQEV